MILTRLKDPFLAIAFATGVTLWSVALWIGVGIVRHWPGFRGWGYGGGIAVAAILGCIGLLLIALAFKPGWKE